MDSMNCVVLKNPSDARKMSLNAMSYENNVHPSCFIKYIRDGYKLGLCEYSIKESMKNGAAIRSEKQKKVVLQYTLDGKFIAEYVCAKYASEIYNCNYKSINSAARGAIKSYIGYLWKYKEGE